MPSLVQGKRPRPRVVSEVASLCNAEGEGGLVALKPRIQELDRSGWVRLWADYVQVQEVVLEVRKVTEASLARHFFMPKLACCHAAFLARVAAYNFVRRIHFCDLAALFSFLQG